MRNTYNDEVMRLFDYEAIPPSQIDEELGKERGYSHDYVVAWWRSDSERIR